MCYIYILYPPPTFPSWGCLLSPLSRSPVSTFIAVRVNEGGEEKKYLWVYKWVYVYILGIYRVYWIYIRWYLYI